MRNAQLLRRIVLVAALGGLGAVPVALAVSADPFGAIEIVDPTWRPKPNFNDASSVIGVDGSGNALWATMARNAQGDGQMAVYERCGSGPVTWSRTLLGTPDPNFLPVGLEVARDGTAMAVWRITVAGTLTHYSAVRPPGGAWGTPQVIVADPQVNYVQFALSDTGAAIATWADSSPVGTWASIRPAGGAWGAPEQIASTSNQNAVAMSATGDAVVLYRGPTPGYALARYRPAGGAWGGVQEVLKNNYQNTMQGLKVEFDGTGRTVALGQFRELNDTIRVNVGTGGTWGSTGQVLDDDGEPPASPQFDRRNLSGLVRHPQGAVAVWTRRQGDPFTDDIVVSRLSGGGWDKPAIFDVDTALGGPTVAITDAGEILLAGTLDHSNVSEIWGTIAPSLTGAWPAMTRMSPLASPTDQYRDAIAGGGGSAFYLAWGVHGGQNQRTEIISTKAAGCAPAPPTPTATPDPLPAQPPAPTATPTPTPGPPAPAPTPRAIADFTTLPPASQCVRNRKLTVRLKRPPKGYTVKTVTVKLNSKRVATLKGKRLKKPLYLRKLPRGTFTLTVSITLTKGKGLTERRRYTACK